MRLARAHNRDTVPLKLPYLVLFFGGGGGRGVGGAPYNGLDIKKYIYNSDNNNDKKN